MIEADQSGSLGRERLSDVDHVRRLAGDAGRGCEVAVIFDRDVKSLRVGLQLICRRLSQEVGRKMLEDVQGLDDGAAGTGPREGRHIRAPVGSAQRLALSHAVDAKIAARDVSASLLHIRHDRLRDRSAIEISSADDAEPSHGLGQVRLPDPGPDIGRVLTVF